MTVPQITDTTFITRVRLKNYKSIAICDVPLRPLIFLVGPNGAGKSNFLDAFRFVADSLRTTLDHALRERGGIAEVRRRSGGHPNHFGIKLNFRLASIEGQYAFQIGAQPKGGYEVKSEECKIWDQALGEPAHFSVQNGKVESTSARVYPPAAIDRLYLVNAAGLKEFRPLYDALSRMGFYNLNPERIRELQSPDALDILSREGGNITSIYENLSQKAPAARKTIEEYLSEVVPGIRGVDVRSLGPKQTLEFRQEVAGADPGRFLAANMSDGTLRAFGVLVSLFQSNNGGASIPLVGIEEPEAALHPAATAVLLESLLEASSKRQVLVTSHSGDLLDSPTVETTSVLAVHANSGKTLIAPIHDAGKAALRDRLYTAGELLRANQLGPDPQHISRTESRQARLFDE